MTLHSLEDEIAQLERDGNPDFGTMRAAAALESRAVFSVRPEILIVLWVAIASITSGIGLLVRAHLDRVGPVALTASMSAAAAVCYAVAFGARLQGRARSLWLDYVLLLGALLAGSALAYAESQFHWLGDDWPRYLLLLAAWNVATAYCFDSRLLLSLGLTGFAAWLGIELSPAALIDSRTPWTGIGWRAIGCAALYAFAAAAHARTASRPAFRDVYEQFAANLALAGSLAVAFTDDGLWAGALLLALFAVTLARYGLWRRRESLVLWAVGYGTLGVVALEVRLLDSGLLASNLGLLTVIAAIVLMLRLRARLKQADA